LMFISNVFRVVRTLYKNRKTKTYYQLVFIALMFLISSQVQAAAQFTSAPSTSSNGIYTLSWSGATTFSSIREKSGATGAWVMLSNPPASTNPEDKKFPPSYSMNITKNTSGIYYYELLDCFFQGGPPNGNPTCNVSDTHTVTVSFAPLSVASSFSASAINEGGTATLTWSSQNATSCSATGISGVSATSGSVTYIAPTVMSANQTVNIPVTCTGGGGSKTATASINVNWVNDIPTISAIANRTINEDTSTGAIAFTVADEETAPASLVLSATSSNTAVIPNGNLVFGGSGTNRTINVTPAANAFGSSTIKVRVTDAHGGFAERSFTVTVNAVNDAPTISTIPNITIDENQSTGARSFTVNDIDTPVNQWDISIVSSSNTPLIPLSNIQLGGSGTNRTINVTPVPNKFGSSTITVQVSDGSLSATRAFTVTVNDLPATFTSIPSASSNGVVSLAWANGREYVGIRVRDSSGAWSTVVHPAAASGSFTDTRTHNGTYTYQLQDCYYAGGPPNGNPTCTPTDDRVVVVTFPAPIVNVSLSPATINEGGTATLTWSSQNTTSCSATGISGVSATSGSVTYTAPTVMSANQTVSIPVTCTGGGGSKTTTASVNVNWVNDAPTIAAIANRTINEDTSTGAIAFTVADEETAAASLTLSATSSNTAVIPNGNLVFGGSGTNRTINVTPAANAFGSSTITVRVTDAHGGFAERVFTVTVNAVNDAPTISDIPNVTINENQATEAISFTVNDIDTPVGQWEVSVVSSSNTALVPLANIQLGGSGTARTIKVTPLPNKFGTSIITVRMSDGSLSVTDTFTVAVTDLLATFTSIPATSNNGVVALSWSNAREYVGIRVSDSAGNWSTVVHPAAASGSYTDTRTQSGTYTYQLQDCYYAGGPPNGNPTCTPTDTRTVVVTFPSPVITASFSPATISESPATGAANTATLSWSATNAQSCSATGISGVTGTSGSVTYTAPSVMTANQTLNAVITCIGMGPSSASKTASLTVNAVNDLPTISAITNQSIQEDQANGTGNIGFTVGDEETAVNSLTVTAVSSNQLLIPNSNLVVGGSGANRTIKATPLPNMFGSATITLTVFDGQASSTRSFVVNVASVNDAPTLSVPGNQRIDKDTSTAALGITVGDVETATTSLTVTATSNKTDVIATNGIVLGGSGANRTIKITPLAGKTGLVDITVNVSDGQITTSKKFTVSVQEKFVNPFDFNSEAPAAFKYELSDSGLPALGVNQLVATTQGDLNVSNGAANYSIPIELPPVVRDLKPNLSLNYNSRSGNGVMGVGWSLGGLSAITRCRTSFATEGAEAQKSNPRYTIGDRLCLDGQKLVVASSTAAANDATYWATGTEYKTELDNFAKIIAYGSSENGGHGYFKVWMKDGRILTFGAENDAQNSKIYAPNQYAGPINVWALDKVEDTYNNSYTITYERDTAKGEYYPSKINLGSTGLVEFSYQDRSGQTPWGYDVGHKYEFTKLLNKVTTYVGTSTGTPVKQFDIRYKTSATTNRELVDKIYECGYENSSRKCALAVIFGWQAGELGFDQTSMPIELIDGSQIIGAPAFDDVNGDGYVDIVDKFTVRAWGTVSGKFRSSGYDVTRVKNSVADIHFRSLQLLTARKGKVGIVTKHRWVYSELKEYTDIYVAQFNPALTTVTYTLLQTLQKSDAILVVGDFNNDGLDDFVLENHMWIQHPTSSTPVFTKSTAIGTTVEGVEPAILDFNNDGLGDLTYVKTRPFTYVSDLNQINQFWGFNNNQHYFDTSISLSFRANPTLVAQIPGSPSGKKASSPGMYRAFIDLNGDGLKDYLYQNFVYSLTTNPYQFPNSWYVRFANGNTAAPYYDEPVNTGIGVADLLNIKANDNIRFSVQYSFPYDYNKDGLEDTILLKTVGPRQWAWSVFYTSYLNGQLFLTDSGIDPFFGRATYLAQSPIASETDNMFRGDVNNDGLPDIIFRSDAESSSRFIYLAAKQQQPDMLVNITNGFGARVELSYSPLTGDDNNGAPLYTPDTVAPVFPQQPVNRAMQVVKKLSTSNGQGGLNHTYFNYTGGVQDIYRGFNGFKSIAITNTATKVNSTTEYRQDWPYTGRIKKQAVKDSSGKLISITENTYALHTQNARFPYLHYSLQKSYELSTTSENLPLSVSKSVNTFDTCGNVTDQTIKIGSGFSGVEVTGELSNQHTVNVYDYYGTPACNDDFLTSSTQEISKAGTTNLKTVVTEFTPNTQGDVKTRTDFKGESIEATTTYERETNGIVNKITETAKDIDGTDAPARVTTFSNFADGIYPQTITNAENHEVSLTYDKRFGSVKTEMSIGLTTTNTYDPLGRLQKQQAPDSTVTESIAFYCSSAPVTCPSGAYYGVASRTTHVSQTGKLGEPLRITFYDALQRELRSVAYSLDGKVINQATEYASNGYLSRVSEPYVTAGVVADVSLATDWTSYSNYDALGRVNTITGADGGSRTTSYATDASGLKVTDNIVVIKPTSGSETQTSSRVINPLGQVVKVEDALYNTVAYSYDSAGNLETTQVNNNVATKIDLVHDLAGNKTYIKDPDAGVIHFDYNGFGELRKQTWQKGVAGVEKHITYAYDKLGRQTNRTDKPASGSTVSYAWVWDTRQQGQLTSRSGNGFTENYYYDGFSRLSRNVVTTSGLSGGEFVYTYDRFSRPETVKYPNGFKIQRDYHAAGYQVQTRDVTVIAAPKVLWALGNTIDVRGHFNNQLWGNGVVTQTGFDNASGRLSNIKSGRLSSANSFSNLSGDIQNLSYTFDSLGNLYSRTTARTDNNGLALENITESFGYDKLNRLKTVTTSGLFGRTQTFEYDTGGLGNLTNRSDVLTGSSVNNDVGQLKYEQVRNAGIHAVTSAGGVNYSYDRYGNMTTRGSETIVYDTFNKPTKITGASTTDFYYGPDHELYKEVSGSKTIYKLAGGVYEVIVDGTTTTQKSYVDGVIFNTRVLTSGTQSANDTHYLHTDHLGSVETTTNALGQFVNRMSFGVWGERQKSDWKPENPAETFLTTNGFTGHDQLDSHNLIHMGGRVYDPNLGRFLSADIIVQFPYFSQSYNRYSYTFNNPLSHTDPSGYDVFTYLMEQSYQQTASFMWSSSVYQAQTQMKNLEQIKQEEQKYADLQKVGVISNYEADIPADYHKTWSTGATSSATLVQCGEGCMRTLLTRTYMGKMGLSPSEMMSLLEGLETASYFAGVTGLAKMVAGKATVGMLRAEGKKDAHHVIQDAAVRDLPGYNTNAAPGIQLLGPSNVVGTPHNLATKIQRQAGGGNYAAERRIGYKALRGAGISKTEARAQILNADEYFRSIGVDFTTLTRIPGNR
jgi:RHS repeat-associated protein